MKDFEVLEFQRRHLDNRPNGCECEICVSGVIYLSDADYDLLMKELNSAPKLMNEKLRKAFEKHGEEFGLD